jgi:hypothetical protein
VVKRKVRFWPIATQSGHSVGLISDAAPLFNSELLLIVSRELTDELFCLLALAVCWRGYKKLSRT